MESAAADRSRADAFQALALFMRSYRAGEWPDIYGVLDSLPEGSERELFAMLADYSLQLVVPPPPTPKQVAEFRALLQTLAEED